jgi:hypothetical protein
MRVQDPTKVYWYINGQGVLEASFDLQRHQSMDLIPGSSYLPPEIKAVARRDNPLFSPKFLCDLRVTDFT